jgi:hypothetical protein
MATAMLFIIDHSMPYYAKILRLTMSYRKVTVTGLSALAGETRLEPPVDERL